MTAMQMVTDLKNEELGYRYPDSTLIEALDTAIEILSGEKPEGNRSAAAKRLIDLKDALQYPDDDEIAAMNMAIIALIAA